MNPSVQIAWIEQELPYTGAELRSHFIYDRFHLLGDAAIAFQGACRVDLAEMVDLEDVKQESPIYSEHMLHFLIEHFGVDLQKLVLMQRILVALMLEELIAQTANADIERIGDDLFEGDAKLSVSIATLTPVSGVIHTGINISSFNTPVLTKGLEDYRIEPRPFAEAVLQAYSAELESAWRATCKVRGVR